MKLVITEERQSAELRSSSVQSKSTPSRKQPPSAPSRRSIRKWVSRQSNSFYGSLGRASLRFLLTSGPKKV